jgi:transmembrane sensor
VTDVPLPTIPRAGTPDWPTLAAYLAGECDRDESRAVAAWLRTNPASADVLDRLDLITSRAVLERPSTLDVEAALRRTRERRAADGRPALILHTAPRAGARRAWLAGGLAAAALVGVVAGLGWRRGAGASLGTTAEARVVATAVGRRDSLRLADGSRVVLAPGSRLVVAAGYGGSAREVALEGAAWFSVRHDAARPFVVRAGGSVVRDLGTEFTVRTDGVAGGRAVAVAVTAGSVSLDTLVLRAGDRAERRVDGTLVAERGTVRDDDVAWTRGRLAYHDAELDEVRADLRRWYGVDLRVDDAVIARRRLTATFDGESADDVLRVIALALGGDVRRDGSTATLRRATRAAP